MRKYACVSECAHVCACIYMCACVYVCEHVCVCACICVLVREWIFNCVCGRLTPCLCEYIDIFSDIYVWVYLSEIECMHESVHVLYACIFVRACICAHVCMSGSLHVCNSTSHSHTHTYICVCVCMYVYICVCV